MSDAELMEVIEDARMVLGGALPSEDVAIGFARALVQVADKCVVGLPCEKHGGAARCTGARQKSCALASSRSSATTQPTTISARTSCTPRSGDEVDARDSLAFLEVTDPEGKEGSA